MKEVQMQIPSTTLPFTMLLLHMPNPSIMLLLSTMLQPHMLHLSTILLLSTMLHLSIINLSTRSPLVHTSMSME